MIHLNLKKMHKFALELSKNAKLIPSLVFKKINYTNKKNNDDLLYQLGLMKFNYLDLAIKANIYLIVLSLVSSANVPLPYVDD